MKEVELILPKMGESIAEATITNWLKSVGDKIEMDEAVVEIATDKVDSEVPSTVAGVLVKQLFKEGDVAPVGSAIAIIGIEASSGDTSAPPTDKPKDKDIEQVVEKIEKEFVQVSGNIAAKPVSQAEGSRFYSPLVLNIARTEGIPMETLETINGTGNEGRVTKRDILAFIQNKEQAPTGVANNQTQENKDASKTETVTITKPQASKITMMPGDEIIEMDRMRKIIADHMVMSKSVSPHVTSFVEADVTNLVMWREKVKKSFEQREGEKITFTPIFIEAIVKAIKDFPMINISVDGDKIVKRKAINIGMATALPNGNLIVPVIKNADNLNLSGIAKTVNDLARRAKENKLLPDDIQNGTYTLTNVGGFGNVMGTPVINQPQVAIMAVGAIRKKPAVIETEFGDVIAIRHMMFLSHAYDHRVVDGSLGGMFVRRVADYLEQWDVNREI
jgi:2-oxoglutarate dehydrogenase E2 component (dihydrolipoamide succinyltransferase)